MSNRTPRPFPETRDRFMTKVTKTETCWIWNAAVNQYGYGRFSNGSTVGAHRASYRIFVGAIPDGMHIDHLCHNQDAGCPGGVSCQHRRCVNPDHLEAVTTRVNLLRGKTITAASASRTCCPKGHPYDTANTIIQGDGKRRCRTCRQAMARRRNRSKTLRRLADGPTS